MTPSSENPALFALEQGDSECPLVLLHGFALTSQHWRPVMKLLPESRRALAFDLPGHGRSASVDWGGKTGNAANVLLTELERRQIQRLHLCGHSLGGALACVMALKRPDIVASLTLLAPGGFGTEINATLLRRFAQAKSRDTLMPLLEQFYGDAMQINESLADNLLADRARPQATEIYRMIGETFLKGKIQGELSRHDLAQTGIPIKVIWGTQDRITPTRQAHKLPGPLAVHVFEETGHSLCDEIPAEIARLIGENMR